MDILRSNITDCGLCLFVGSYSSDLIARLRHVDGYQEDQEPLTLGPVSCFGTYSPKDRHHEYIVKLVKDSHVLEQMADPIIKAHIETHGAQRLTYVICVDADEGLKAYNNASMWLELLPAQLTEMITKDPIFASKFKDVENANSVTERLGFSTVFLMLSRTTPDLNFTRAMRRLAKNHKVNVLLACQFQEPISDIAVTRLRDLMTGGVPELKENIMAPLDQLFIVPERDESIDVEMPPSSAPEVTLKATPATEESGVGDVAIAQQIEVVGECQIGLESVLKQIWAEEAKRHPDFGRVN